MTRRSFSPFFPRRAQRPTMSRRGAGQGFVRGSMAYPGGQFDHIHGMFGGKRREIRPPPRGLLDRLRPRIPPIGTGPWHSSTNGRCPFSPRCHNGCHWSRLKRMRGFRSLICRRFPSSRLIKRAETDPVVQAICRQAIGSLKGKIVVKRLWQAGAVVPPGHAPRRKQGHSTWTGHFSGRTAHGTQGRGPRSTRKAASRKAPSPALFSGGTTSPRKRRHGRKLSAKFEGNSRGWFQVDWQFPRRLPNACGLGCRAGTLPNGRRVIEHHRRRTAKLFGAASPPSPRLPGRPGNMKTRHRHRSPTKTTPFRPGAAAACAPEGPFPVRVGPPDPGRRS